mgnify:CR=1 FL=1
MATFQVQVTGLTGITISSSGTSPTEAQLTQFLTDGAKEIINQMPKRLLPLCATEQTFTSGTPQTLNTGNILYVTRSDGTIAQSCRYIKPNLVGRSLDSEDMNAATATDPIYYIKNNTLDIAPSSGSSVYSEVQYPAVTYSASAIAIFPDEAEYLVPLYASVKSLQNKMSSKFAELPTDVTFISLPVAPVAPVLISNQIGTLPTAPVYTGLSIAPSFSTVDTFISTDEDVELASVKIQEINSQINEYQASMQNQINLFNDANVEYQAEVNKLTENARLSSQDDVQSLQKYSNELGSYGTRVQIYQADASTKIQNYSAKIQKHVTDYQWLLGQYKQLKDDYTAGLQKLVS